MQQSNGTPAVDQVAAIAKARAYTYFRWLMVL